MVYVGTYASAKDPGIYAFRMDPATGALTAAGSVSGVANPSFLAVHPDRRHLYAACEAGAGAVAAFSIDPETGLPALLNQEPSTGNGPCHVSVDPAGKNVLVAHYGNGSVAVLPIRADGRVAPATATVQHAGSGANKQRQEGPHAHSINVDTAGRFAVAADLGLDKLLVYRFDASKGTLAPNDPPAASTAPGAGPRHFAFHPSGRFAYAIHEMNSTLSAYAYDAQRGVLTELNTLTTLPAGFSGNNSTAEVLVHPSGKFVYGSNRGHDSIAIFAVDPGTGRLQSVGHQPTQGKTPRNFGVDPTGNFLIAANQDTNNLVVFRIDTGTGRLTPTGHTAEVPKPVCVRFLPPAAP